MCKGFERVTAGESILDDIAVVVNVGESFVAGC